MNTNNRPSPVNDYDEMAGWPGTIPTARLLTALSAIKNGTPHETLDPQTQEDITGFVHSHKCNLISSQHHPEGITSVAIEDAKRQFPEAPGWAQTVLAARAHDTKTTIGGIIVWMKESTEKNAIFSLLRHPEWMGMNRILPLMKDMNVMIFESQEIPNSPGLLVAQTQWGKVERTEGQPVPPGETQQIESILRWHGARELLWIGR